MEIGFKKVACNLLGITARSYSNWDKEKRPIINLLEKNYISKKDIEEFLEKGKIEKLELIKHFSTKELKEKLSISSISGKDIIINKLNNFSLGSLISFILFLSKNKNSFVSKQDLIEKIENEMSIFNTNMYGDMSTYFSKKDLIKTINLILDDDDIQFINKNKDEFLSVLEFHIENKRSFLDKFAVDKIKKFIDKVGEIVGDKK